MGVRHHKKDICLFAEPDTIITKKKTLQQLQGFFEDYY